MAGNGTAPCPHCRAENLAHRRECWRCKRTLPTSFALDARRRPEPTIAPLTPPAPTRAEIDEALSQAVVISQGDGQEDLPYASGGFGKRLIWILRKRTMHG